MLQQTPVARVVPRLEAWLDPLADPGGPRGLPRGGRGARLGPARLPATRPRPARGRAVIAEQHGNVVPRDVDALLALPGIGDYTARAVAVFAYGDRHPVVDTNVRRVLARACTDRANPGRRTPKHDLPLMESQLPDDRDDAAATNAGVMELGALVCVARSPRCDACPLADRVRLGAGGLPGARRPRAPQAVAVRRAATGRCAG